MDIYDIIALSTGLTSVFLGIFAVILALHQKKAADKVNEKTLELLIDVKTDANIISKIAIPELKEYGKSMRRLVFREERGNQNLELDNIGEKIEKSVAKSMSHFNIQIDGIKKEINSNSGLEKDSKKEFEKINIQLENLRKIAFESENEIRRDIKEITEDIEVDLSSIGKPSLKVSHGYFDSVSSFLNMLFSDYLKGKVRMWSYGETWILKNKRTGKFIHKEGGQHDIRSLKTADILPGDFLEFVRLKK